MALYACFWLNKSFGTLSTAKSIPESFCLSKARKDYFTSSNQCLIIGKTYRALSHDVRATILVFQNNETEAMPSFQSNPVGVKLFSSANVFFCSNKFCIDAGYVSVNGYQF